MKNSSLFKQQAYVAGEWINSTNGKKHDVYNPATLEIFGTVPDLQAKEIECAVNAAETSFKKWKNILPKERGAYLRRWAELMQDNVDDLAKIMTLESGKPLTEAKTEISYAAGFFEFYAEEARRAYGNIIPPSEQGKIFTVIRQPVGVVAAITPWNFPAAMVTRKVAPALAAGCSVVLKPALETPFTALALAALAEQAGIPKGVFSVVTGDSKIISSVLTSHDAIKHLSFTGSTDVGKLLMQQCASSLKKVSFELGGHAPFIVFDDADLDNAVTGLIASKFRNAGQTCVCANRIFVHEEIYDQFKTVLLEKTSHLKTGNGLDSNVQIGPLINEKGLRKVVHQVEEAVSKGALILTGGKISDQHKKLGGWFYEPTILDNVTDDMLIANEETFGPVIPLLKFTDEDEIIRRANQLPYGLSAYFYTENTHRAWRVYDQLEAGMIGINTGAISYPEVPFGGVKQSGIGREGGHYGLDEYLEIKYAAWG